MNLYDTANDIKYLFVVKCSLTKVEMEKTTGAKQRSSKLSFSPMKGTKYKNFLTSILSPSAPKRRPKKEMSSSRQDTGYPVPSNIAQQSNESIYSSIEDAGNAHIHRKSSLLSVNSSEIDAMQSTLNRTEPKVTKAMLEEPIYATVHKPPIKPKRMSWVSESDTAALHDAKENNKLLQQRLKELSEENCCLKKQLQDFEKQEEMEEATLHSKLQLEITQLEAETRKEVKSLSDRIVMLVEEKSLLSDQLDLLHREKRETQVKYEALSSEARKKVDPELHANTITEYKRLLEQTKQKYNAELNEYKDKYETLCIEKESLETLSQQLKGRLASSIAKIGVLEGEGMLSKEERERLGVQLGESRQLEEDHQKLLLSLLKVTETLAVERDVLLNKTSFQENQQKELQTSVVGYSLNVGRLQEHIVNLSKESLQELLHLHSKKSYREESVHEYYTEQLDILREKILNQSNTITKMETEKRKLEMQLESHWETYT